MPLLRPRTARPGSVLYLIYALAAAALQAAVPVAAPGAGGEPAAAFAPGLVWSRASDAAFPWVPRSVAIAGGGTLVWAAGSVTNPNLMAFPMAGGSAAARDGATSPMFQDLGLADALGVLTVAAGQAGERLFALAQRPNPDPLNRRSEIRAYDPEASARSGSFAPVWSHDLLLGANGPARIAVSADGACVVGAAWDDTAGEVHVHWLDGNAATATPTATVVVPALTLSGLAIADDGSRVALTGGQELWVFDATGTIVHQETLASATRTIAFSGDGATLLVGGIGRLDVLVEGAGGYVPEHVVVGAGSEIAAEVDISPDGSTYAIGWWVYTTGVSLRFELVDRATHGRLAQVVHTGVDGGLQNRPETVAVSRDGRRAALGAWGDGVSSPEVVLLERGRSTPVLELDLAGSVQDLALNEDGTRIVVAAKSTHANAFGSTGSVEVHSTGEGDLVLRRGPTVGGSLDLAAQRPGASLVLFLVGRRLSTPLTFEEAGGALWLERTRRLISYPAATDAAGTAEHSVPIPDLPRMIGMRRSIQAAFRMGDGLVFGETVLDFWVL